MELRDLDHEMVGYDRLIGFGSFVDSNRLPEDPAGSHLSTDSPKYLIMTITPSSNCRSKRGIIGNLGSYWGIFGMWATRQNVETWVIRGVVY